MKDPRLLRQFIDQTAKDVTAMADPRHRCSAWTEIAEARFAIGDREGAREAMAAADQDAALTKDAGERAELYPQIGIACARAGDGRGLQDRLRHPMAAMGEITDRDAVPDALHGMIEAEAAVGNPDTALSLCEQIKDAYSRGDAYRALAQAAVGAGKRDLFLKAVELASRAAAQISPGQDSPLCGAELLKTVRLRVDAGDYRGAGEAIEKIKFPESRAEGYVYLARGVAKASPVEARQWLIKGLSAGALASDFNDFKADALVEIALARMELSDKDGALQALKTCEASVAKVTAADNTRCVARQLARMAEGYTVAGDLAHANPLMKRAIDGVNKKTKTTESLAVHWLWIASAQAAMGDVSAYRRSIEQTRATPDAIEMLSAGFSPDSIAKRISTNLVRAGKLKDAMVFAGGLKASESRVEAFNAMVRLLLDRGETDSAWQTAQQIPDTSDNACYILSLSECRAGHMTKMLKAAAALSTPSQRVAAGIAGIEVLAPAATGMLTYSEDAPATEPAPGASPPDVAGPGRIVYVCNASASTINCLSLGQTRLHQSISEMKPDDLFDVITFQNGKTIPLAGGMLAASPANRKRADQLIDALRPLGQTHMLAPLQQAMKLKPRTILLVTNMLGYEKEPGQIVEQLRKLNAAKFTRIDVVQISTSRSTLSNVEELKEIAEESGGSYSEMLTQ